MILGLRNPYTMMIKLKLALFKLVCTFLIGHLLKLDHHSRLLHAWVGDVQKRALTRGTVDTIGFLKELRLCYTRYLCGSPFSNKSPGLGIQLVDGLPKGGLLNELFRERDPLLVRLGLTLLGVSRILPGWKSPDLSTVTTPPVSMSLSIESDIVGVVKSLGWKLPLPEWEECHVTTKAGPNAQALVGSIEDAHLLTESQISDLRLLGGDELVRTIETSKLLSPLTWLEYFKLQPKGRSGKLSLVKDKEAKTRIVAVLDYWTQSALKPLHESQMRFLKSLKPDMTFNQGGFRSTLSKGGPYHSLDLTAATDRFPVAIQEKVLAQLVGSSEWAAAWRRLICDRDYTISWGNRRDTVRYACGQPMGAYSSWSTFSICHHAVVRLAAVRAGFSYKFSGYALLGDDIVIANDAVAAEYRTIISSIGVSLSEAKTHVSNDTYEFAKRWIYRGTEVSGAPFGSLFEAIRFVGKDAMKALGEDFVPTKAIRHISYYEVVTWIREVEGRWKPRNASLGPRGLFATLFTLLGRGPIADRLATKAWRFYLLPSREDSRLIRHWKAFMLLQSIGPGMVSCFSWQRAPISIGTLLNECKARVLEGAIKNQLDQLRRFQLEGSKLIGLVPEGLDAQSILPFLAPLAVLRRNVAELQLEFDKAHRVRESDDISQWLHLDVRLFLDPFAVLSTRRSKTMASAKVTVLNHLSAMIRGIEFIRDVALTDIGLMALVRLINSHEVTPTRGDRKRTRKAPSRKRKASSVG